MSDEQSSYARALQAYAAETSGEALDAGKLRQRVLAPLPAPRRATSRKLSLILPLAATFIASAALAAGQPAVRDALQHGWNALLGRAAHDTPSPAPQSRALPRTEAPPPSAQPAPVIPPPEPTPLAPEDLPALGETPQRPVASARPSSSLAKPVSEPALNPEVESYRQAHRTHFGGAPPSVALAAWDSYLVEYPAGTFALDARFNRALCLVRLGRRDHARAALAPFADAPIGSYRQAEAASLLLSLDSAR